MDLCDSCFEKKHSATGVHTNTPTHIHTESNGNVWVYVKILNEKNILSFTQKPLYEGLNDKWMGEWIMGHFGGLSWHHLQVRLPKEKVIAQFIIWIP